MPKKPLAFVPANTRKAAAASATAASALTTGLSLNSASTEGLDVIAAQEALAALIPEIEQLAEKVDSIFSTFVKEIAEGDGEFKETGDRVERLRFFVFLGITGVHYRLTEQVIPAVLRVANRKASDYREVSAGEAPAGEAKPEAADNKPKKKPVAKSLTKAQLLAKLQAAQYQVERLDEMWDTSLNGLAKFLRILAKASGYLGFLEKGGLILGPNSFRTRENDSDEQPEVITSADILAFFKT